MKPTCIHKAFFQAKWTALWGCCAIRGETEVAYEGSDNKNRNSESSFFLVKTEKLLFLLDA